MANHTEKGIVIVPGVCAGHPEHPELLWIFQQLPSGKLKFQRIEIDFPEPEEVEEVAFRKFDVDMSGFKHCPYCEAELYFFCKRCRSLSCFAWSQISDSNHWTCHSCNSVYRMKPKRTPFRIEAQGNENASAGANASQNTNMGNSSQTSSHRVGTKTSSLTFQWHPKRRK